jgi:hypothetical protein
MYFSEGFALRIMLELRDEAMMSGMIPVWSGQECGTGVAPRGRVELLQAHVASSNERGCER